MTNPKLVADRIAAETQQASTLNSFEFKLDGKPITANEIDNSAPEQHGPEGAPRGLGGLEAIGPGAEARPREAAGAAQRRREGAGLSRLLRPPGGELRHDDRRDGQAAGRLHAELRPLYLQLHTWAKYELAKKYGQPVPEAHSRALAQQSLEPELDGDGRRRPNLDDRFKGRSHRSGSSRRPSSSTPASASARCPRRSGRSRTSIR